VSATASTPTLGDALRLLGLPLDAPIDEQMLVGAYRDAAREHHPDAAPEDMRDAQTERMRQINLARDLVRASLTRLQAEPFASFAPEDDEARGAWWDVSAEDLAELGIRWNPNARRVPWAKRVRAARLSLGVVVGDDVTVEEQGALRVGRVVAFDESTRVGLRTSLHGIPVEVRRVGLEVEFPGEERRTVDAADVQACGWRCPVCLRTSPHGLPRTRPCPRCLRRFRAGYERWRDAALERGRLRRRLARLSSEGGAPFTPRRYPAFREREAVLIAARERASSLEETRAAIVAAIAAAEAAEQEAEIRIGRARSEGGADKRRKERAQWAGEARRARAALAGVEADIDETIRRVIDLASEVDDLERSLRMRHDAAEQAREAGAERRERDRKQTESELRAVELELAALNPDSIALLDGFEAWGEQVERWLG
jgi:hypothetical protein